MPNKKWEKKMMEKMTKKQAKLEIQAMLINMHNGVMCYIHEPEAFDVPEDEPYEFDMNDPLEKILFLSHGIRSKRNQLC
jgi:hypothetical protein